MENEIPDVWGDNITFATRSPAMILNYQAEKLKQKTQGLIIGELTAIRSQEITTLMFDLIAPAAKNVRMRVLTVKYHTDEVYPVVVAGEGLDGLDQMPIPEDLVVDDISVHVQSAANSEGEFLKAIAVVLQSPAIVSRINSLIARSNEVKNPPVGLRIQELDAPLATAGAGH